MTIEARVLDSIDDGFIAIDSAGRVSYCNEAAASFLGFETRSPVGRDLFDAAPSLRGTPLETDVRTAMTQAVRRRCPASNVVDDRSFELLATPLSDGGLVLQFTEVTHRAERDRLMADELARLEHDLRNPLAPLRTSLELLNRATVAEATKERARTIMDRQLAQMVGLIERLHEFARRLRAGEGLAGGAPVSQHPGEARALLVSGQHKDGQGTRVLVADDSALVQQAIVALLRAEGYEVRTVSDGLEAIAAVDEWRPRYVLLDLNMPRLGGVEAAKRLRLLYPSGEVVLLMMSGVTLDDAWRSHASKAGFDACLDKTADPAEWLSAMRQAGAAAGLPAGLTSVGPDASAKS